VHRVLVGCSENGGRRVYRRARGSELRDPGYAACEGGGLERGGGKKARVRVRFGIFAVSQPVGVPLVPQAFVYEKGLEARA